MDPVPSDIHAREGRIRHASDVRGACRDEQNAVENHAHAYIADGESASWVMQLAAAECDLDCRGPLVRAVVGRLERAFYNTAADLRQLGLTGWDRFALPPPLEAAAHRVLAHGGPRLLGSHPERTGTLPPTETPQTAQIWSALVQKDLHAWLRKDDSVTAVHGAKRLAGSRPISSCVAEQSCAACFVAMPVDLLPCRVLRGCAVQLLMLARQVCLRWREVIDADRQMWYVCACRAAPTPNMRTVVGRAG